MLVRRISLRGLTTAAILVVGVGLLACAPFFGRFLSVEDPLDPADAIYVLGGSRADRPLEAADLYQAAYAKRIVLSDGYTDYATRLLRQKGVHVPGQADTSRAILLQLGVPKEAIIIPPGNPGSTRDEAATIRTVALEKGWRTIIVVTPKLHTRRARLAMQRYLDPADVRVIMRGSRYDRADPLRWWRDRNDVRMTLTELQFWIAYAVGLAL